MTRRSFLSALFVGGGTLALSGCAGSPSPNGEKASSDAASGPTSGSTQSGQQADSSLITKPLDNGFDKGLHHATIEIANYGTIELELNATNTPITVSNFAQLASDGFYNGLTFHRIISGFMIQGGDPKGNGTGGSEKSIKGEFSANGVVNAIQHKRGTISMARSSDNNSASSQFFIMHQDNASLDGQYAAFGKVTSGIEVVDAICANTPVTDDNGTVEKANQPVITSLKMVD
ncbi:MAG: peptidylprolyl isomerase [Olsenella sp.]|nr:peptidylprolyl isomerase [Olsenella sp.]